MEFHHEALVTLLAEYFLRFLCDFQDVTTKFCHTNNLDFISRAHQMCEAVCFFSGELTDRAIYGDMIIVSVLSFLRLIIATDVETRQRLWR